MPNNLVAEKQITTPGVADKVRVDDYSISLNRWAAFEKFCETGSTQDAADAGGVKLRMAYRWRNMPWWKHCIQQHFAGVQEELHVGLMKRKDTALKAYDEIVAGKRPDDKTANAAMTGIKLLTEIGKEPLLNRRSHIEVGATHTTITGGNNLIVTPGLLKEIGLTQEDVLDWHNSGRQPQKLVDHLASSAEGENDDNDDIDVIAEEVEGD